jgi:hypothetical protein
MKRAFLEISEEMEGSWKMRTKKSVSRIGKIFFIKFTCVTRKPPPAEGLILCRRWMERRTTIAL